MDKPEIKVNQSGRILIEKLCDSALKYEGIQVLNIVGETLKAMIPEVKESKDGQDKV